MGYQTWESASSFMPVSESVTLSVRRLFQFLISCSTIHSTSCLTIDGSKYTISNTNSMSDASLVTRRESSLIKHEIVTVTGTSGTLWSPGFGQANGRGLVCGRLDVTSWDWSEHPIQADHHQADLRFSYVALILYQPFSTVLWYNFYFKTLLTYCFYKEIIMNRVLIELRI